MDNVLSSDEDLLRRLPLPLAQLYRRAHNAKTPLERHLTAFYLWEASLKLLATVALAEFAQRPDPDAQLAERLRHLAKPSLGHWWEFVRRLIPILADRGDRHFQKARDLILGRARDDLPRAAGLDVVLREVLEGKQGARSAVRLTELFDRLVQYRNKTLAHAAPGQLKNELNERLSRALLSGVSELLAKLDILGGRRLVYVSEVRQSAGVWLVHCYELVGENARRIASLEVPRQETERIPEAEHVYLAPCQGDLTTTTPGAAPSVAVGESLIGQSVHPLLLYEPDSDEALFLNARRARNRTEYLCYTSGRVLDRPDLGTAQCRFLTRLLSQPVDAAEAGRWAADSAVEEGVGIGAEAPSGRQIAEFELLSELGRGGMGVVYRAFQPSLGRQVALKCLLRSGDKAEERFGREIRALGSVEHPHLVKIFTSGTDGDQWFYAMELVEGATLADVCDKLLERKSEASALDIKTWEQVLSTVCIESRKKEKSLSGTQAPAAHATMPAERRATMPGLAPAVAGYVPRVVELTRQVAEAVHALHEAGVIHRDIKPGNIMANAGGTQAVLMDLGLAQLADDVEGRLTRTRQFVGTLRYASPEQVLAVGTLDRRSDVYSLGATLWELLTLRPLYGATQATPTPDLMQQIQFEEPERLRKYNREVGRDLEAIVLKCLEKDRKRRYASAQELAVELRRYLRGEPVHARPVGQVERTRRWCRQNRLVAGLLTGLLVALVGGLLGVSWKWREAERHAAAEVEARAAAERHRHEAEEQHRQSKLLSANLSLDHGLGLCEKGHVGQGLLWLARSLEVAPADAADLRRVVQANLAAWQAHAQTLRFFARHPSGGAIETAALSPNGRLLLTGSSNQTAQLWDTLTGAALGSPWQHPGKVQVVAFAPDSKSALTLDSRGAVRRWEVPAKSAEPQIVAEHPGARVLALAADGRTFVTGGEREACVWESASGAKLQNILHAAEVHAVALNADGKRLLTGSKDRMARLWDVEAAAVVGVPIAHFDQVDAVAFSPDGRKFLTGDKHGTVQLFDQAGKLLRALQQIDFNHVRALAFNPDGTMVLTAGLDGITRLYDVEAGSLSMEFLRHRNQVCAVAFGPEGRTILTASWDGTARLWALESKLPPHPTIPHRLLVASAAFHPKRPLVLTGTGDNNPFLSPTGKGDVQMWDLATGKALGAPLLHKHAVLSVAFNADGSLMLTGSGHPLFGNGEARLWDTATGQMLGQPLEHAQAVQGVAFCPDGRTLLTCSYVEGGGKGEARLWDLAGRPQGTLRHPDKGIIAAAFSPDGKTILTGGADSTARLWDAASLKPIGKPFPHSGMVLAVAFDREGKHILTGSTDNLARLWKVGYSEAPQRTFPHKCFVRTVCFSPDGHTLLTGGFDLTARLWDAGTGKPIGKPIRHQNYVTAAAFAPDGKVLLTGSTDRFVRFWNVPDHADEDLHKLVLGVQVTTGVELLPDGSENVLDDATWNGRRQRLEKLGGIVR